MASRLGCSGALIVASMLFTTVASADPSAADRETARTLMDQGHVLLDKGDVREALKRFQAADEIMHVPTTAVPVAKLQAALGLLVEARDTLASSMRRTPEKANDPQPFKDARAEGERLDASLAERVPGLTITVKGAAEGEKPALAIDGLDVPAAALGLPRAVDPGHHVLVAKTPTAEGRQELDVREGEQRALEITLVTTGAPRIQPSRVTPGTPVAPDAPAASVTSHSPGLVTWIGVGLAGAGVITGSVTGLMAMSKTSGLTSECANHICGPAAHSDLDSANTLATVSNVAFAVAGVGAAVAVISLVVGHEAATERPAESPGAAAPTAHVWIGLGAAGLRGSF
jgi:hypothetical protein